MAAQFTNSKKPGKTLVFLILSISVLTVWVTLQGIFSDQGSGSYAYESIRGETIVIYGKGIYQHMSAEVAIQGIAQDYLTLCLAVPLLLLSWYFSMKGSLKWRIILAGTIGYFFVTYLFYTTMGMYNQFFLAYIAILGASFFALSITLLSFDVQNLASNFSTKAPLKWCGGFLIFSAAIIALLWLSIIIPPLADGTVYPRSVEHYTTLIVQGLDLGLLLPLSFVCGVLLIRKQDLGYLLAPVYLVFLSLLMAALVCKVVYMGLAGYSIIPAIFIIPVITIIAIACAFTLLHHVKPVSNSEGTVR